MSEKINLPSSSIDELIKIIKGYSHSGTGSSLDSLAKLLGINKTSVSGNNKFLGDLSLIQGGNSKSATDLGKKLGRALDHGQLEDAKNCWREAVSSNEAISGLVTTVRIKGGMKLDDLSAHVLYVSGQGNNARNRTGSKTIVDILQAAGLVENNDGFIKVSSPASGPEKKEVEPEPIPSSQDTQTTAQAQPSQTNVAPTSTPAVNLSGLSNTPQIAINIQLHLPETDNAEVYEKLFKALKDNLLSGNE